MSRMEHHEQDDVYFGLGQAILKQRERIKRKTIETRRLLHANPPHIQTNRMSRILFWIRPPSGPKFLTADSRYGSQARCARPSPPRLMGLARS